MPLQNITSQVKIHQEALLQLLQEFDRVCRKLDIKYTLFAKKQVLLDKIPNEFCCFITFRML